MASSTRPTRRSSPRWKRRARRFSWRCRLRTSSAGQIDFESDLQPGDTFEVLVEKFTRDGLFAGYGPILGARFGADGREHQAFRWSNPDTTRAAYYDDNGRSLKRFMLRTPLKFEPRITSGFSTNRLHPVFRTYHAHLGIDYAAPIGAPVVAVSSGSVVSAGWAGGGGNQVRLRHSGGYETLLSPPLSVRTRHPRRRSRRAGPTRRQGGCNGDRHRSTSRLSSQAERRVREPARGSTIAAARRSDTADASRFLLSVPGRHGTPALNHRAGRGPVVVETGRRRRKIADKSVRVPSPVGILAAPEPPARMAGWLPSIRSRHCVQRPPRPPSVSSVPYDVVSTDEARQLAAGNPLSFLHVTRSEIDFPPDADPYSSEVYDKARANLDALRASAPLVVDDVPGAVFLSAAHGRARTDGRGRLLFARRVRSRHHQEARAHPTRQGGRSHAAHDQPPGPDRRCLPDISRRANCRSTAADRHVRRCRCTTSPPPTACGTPSGGPVRSRPRPWWPRSRGSRRSILRTGIIEWRALRERGRSWERPGRMVQPARARSSPWRSPTARSRSFRTTAP